MDENFNSHFGAITMVLIDSSLAPAPRKIKPKIILNNIVIPNRVASDVVSLATFNNSLNNKY